MNYLVSSFSLNIDIEFHDKLRILLIKLIFLLIFSSHYSFYFMNVKFNFSIMKYKLNLFLDCWFKLIIAQIFPPLLE